MNRLAITLFLCALLCAPCAFADTVSLSPCGCGDDAPAIQQAIATVTQSGTVSGTIVLEGTFELHGTVNIAFPNLTLTAAPSGATVVAPNLTAFQLLAGADGFTMSHLTVITRRGLYTPSDVAINNVSIVENTFDTVTRAISQFVGNGLSSGWVIRSNTFLATDTSACSSDNGCVAILATGTKGLIENNSIQYNGLGNGIVLQNNHGVAGVTADSGNGWSVQGNTLDADVAIWVNGGSSNHIAGNHSTQRGSYGVVVAPGLPAEMFIGIVVNAEMNKVSDNEILNKSVAGIVLADDTDGNSILRNNIVMTGGTGIDLGSDFNGVPGIHIGPATDNQVHANMLASGAVGINLRLNSQDNIVTGNQISTTSAPAQGIVQESTTTGNLVRGNPGFDPITGSGKSFAAPVKLLGPGN